MTPGTPARARPGAPAARAATLLAPAAAALLLAPSCYAPDLGRCLVACTPARGCPDDLVCRVDGFCHDPGAPADEVCAPLPDGPAADAEPRDGPRPDAPPPDAACGEDWYTAVADTSLAGDSVQVFGGHAVANVGVGIHSVGLFRFAASVEWDRVASARLRLSYAETSDACNGTPQIDCTSCAGIDAPGLLALFAMRSDWDEDAASWTIRRGTTAWDAPGASLAGVDRSLEALATVQHEDASATEIEIPRAAFPTLATWNLGGELSLQLVPSSGAVFVIATRESPSEPCGPYPPPTLIVETCR